MGWEDDAPIWHDQEFWAEGQVPDEVIELDPLHDAPTETELRSTSCDPD